MVFQFFCVDKNHKASMIVIIRVVEFDVKQDIVAHLCDDLAMWINLNCLSKVMKAEQKTEDAEQY